MIKKIAKWTRKWKDKKQQVIINLTATFWLKQIQNGFQIYCPAGLLLEDYRKILATINMVSPLNYQNCF